MVDADALSRVLGSVVLEVGISRRVTLAADGVLPLPVGAVTLVYLADGRVHGHPPLHAGCGIDIGRPSAGSGLTLTRGAEHLIAGDAFLSLGERAIDLRSVEGASVLTIEVVLSDAASRLASLLPATVTVTGFDALEPSAAALASTMGVPDTLHPGRRGDPVICRMMATTVLLSVIRAWADNGCAPSGWPAETRDPFLDRVVEAIHEQPGDEWTVERLAGIGAMSRSVFAQRFRAAIGRSPADYVTEVRIDAAKRMLDAGRSVSDTSRALGYASDEGFSRAFRRRTGVTPSAWRAEHREAALV